MHPSTITTWILTDGKAGMVNQCLGLAQALGVEPDVRTIAVRQPWLSLPPQLWLSPFSALRTRSDRLAPPWPDLLIASGRITVALSRAVRQRSGGRTFTVQIQNPAIPLQNFDLVVTPAHDRLHGPNVLSTRGALGLVRPGRLQAEAERFRAGVADLPGPRIMVSLGGDNGAYRMTEAVIDRLATDLRTMITDEGGSLLITPSRRTDETLAARLRHAIADLPHRWYDGQGDNPYLGWLGLADAVVVTGDSVNMVSEACATGKPVLVVQLEGGNAKFGRFHEAMTRDGLTRPFAGRLERWTYPPLDDTAMVADHVRAGLQQRQRPGVAKGS